MTNFLIKRFIKNPDNILDSAVRQSYGSLSSGVGLVCNILLFLIKYIMGTVSGSISIISDAFNNLSDSGGCIVTFLGYKMASKPADKGHPFGHGRVEYLTSLILSVIIVLVGFELLKSSAGKIADPEPVKFSVIVLLSLIISICVKLWLSVFNMKLGRKIKSSVMTATAEDSRNDVIATSATVIALVSSLFTDFPVDGIMGVIVSVFILKTGFEIICDTVDDLIGKPVSSEIAENIKRSILSDSDIIDIHDLVIHNYGVTNMIGSCHIEIRSNMSFPEVHEVADRTERRIFNELNIIMTIHTDPVDVDDEQTNKYKAIVREIVSSLNQGLSIHDFRIVSCENHRNVIFDITVPYDCSLDNKSIKSYIDRELLKHKCFAVMNFDREYF